ncbi:Hypothetical_protein [Hexamita inflata]|uniref:Hypothetical_protein n=1 Tax=Hexamita inflata TaxID=28002 RepID=A0AA86PNG1_9EUKA|nr:Hypothetical protein HINF_LOCUS30874 [Hexamita inflata]
MRQIDDVQNKVVFLAVKSVRATNALLHLLNFPRRRSSDYRLEIKHFSKRVIYTELFFQYLFNVPNQYHHPYNAILGGQVVYLLEVFTTHVFVSYREIITFHVFSLIFFSYLTCVNFHSLKYWLSGSLAGSFLILYNYQNRKGQQPNDEVIKLKQQRNEIDLMYNNHYSKQIQEINEEIQSKVVVVTIRTNLNPPISETVKFTRLVEQICKQNQVKTIQVSLQVFQFFVQDDNVQKMLDDCVQICAGAKKISESLGITISAGIAFGDIELVTHIFGNLQHRCLYGDVIEISDLISLQSFDEVRVELTSLFNKEARRDPNLCLDELQRNVPTFKFSEQVDKIEYQDICLITSQMLFSEWDNNLNTMQDGNVRESTFTKGISLQFENDGLNDFTKWRNSTFNRLSQLNMCDYTNSVSKYQLNLEKQDLLNINTINIEDSLTSTPRTHQVDTYKPQPIFKVCADAEKSEEVENNQIMDKRILSRAVKLLSTSKKLSKLLIIKYIRQTSTSFGTIIASVFNITQACALYINLNATFNSISQNYGVIIFNGQYPIKTVLTIFSNILILDNVLRLVCLVLLIYLYVIRQNRWNSSQKKIIENTVQTIENVLFSLAIIYNFSIQYSLELMFQLLDRYNLLVIKHNAIAHGWLIIFFQNFNFMQAMNISAQTPHQISKSIKVFVLMEIMHYARMAKKFPQYVLFMAVSQVSQIPWLLQQASVGVNNIGTKIKMRDYIKKQAVILSRHRPHLQASGELLIITKDQPTLNQDVIGQLNVKYKSVKYPESGSDLVNRVQAQLKDQLPHFPVVLFNNAVVFRLDFPTRPVEETNCLFADVTNAFSSREHLSLLSSSRNAARWISYHEKNDANSAYWHLQLALYNVLEVLHRHPEAGAALSFGDLKGVTLCYEDVRHDAVGEATEELEQIISAPGKLTVSKRFWAQFVQRALENCGGQKQNLQFQKQFVDGGKMVQLWK